MSHRGHCEARRPGSKGHFLHRGGGATGSATCPFAQLGKVYKRVAGMLCGELVIPQYRSSVFLYRGRFEQRNVLEWVPKFSPQIRWHYVSHASPFIDLKTCQHLVILWVGQLKIYPLWLFIVQRHLSTLRPISCNPQTLIPSMHCKICTSQKVRPRRRNPCQKHDVYLMASIWQVSRRCRSRYGVDKVIAGEMDLGLAASISACVILEIHE